MPNPTKRRKIAMMGHSSVGKSALSFQFMEHKFIESYDPTIENTFKKNVNINSQDYELILIDTAGQDEYSIFPAQYLIDVHGYVLVYDIINRNSFDVVSSLYDRLLGITGNSNIPVILIGNKVDLSEFRQVSVNDGKKLAEKWKSSFLETSAKNNEHVRMIFEILLRDIEKVEEKMPSSACVIS